MIALFIKIEDLPGTFSTGRISSLVCICWIVGAFEQPSVRSQVTILGSRFREELGARDLCMRHMSLAFKTMSMNTMV